VPDSPVPRSSRKPVFGLYGALATIALGGLAAGALWCVLALTLRSWAGLLVLPTGFAIGFYFRWLGYRGVRGAACAVAAMLIAFVYAQWLFAAVHVAQMLGFALRYTLFKMDLGLAWQAARTNLSAVDFALLALAAGAAGGIAGRK